MKKSTPKIIAAIVCAAVLVFQSGCSSGSIYSNYREIEQLMIIQTMGFDISPEGYRLSVSASNSSSGGSDTQGGGGGSVGKSSIVRMGAQAKTLTLAQDIIQDYSASEQLFFQHTAYIVIGVEAAKRSLEHYFKYIERDNSFRLDTPLFIVTNASASKLVLGTGSAEYDATEVLRSLERNLMLRGDTYVFSAAEIAANLDTNGSGLISAVRLADAGSSNADSEEGELTALPDGYAIIKHGMMIGRIPYSEAKGVNILLNKTGPCNIEVSTDGGTSAMQLTECECRIRPVFSDGGRLKGLQADIKVKAAVAESGKDTDNEQLCGALEEKIKHLTAAVLERSVGLECDFLQLGSLLEREEPRRLNGYDKLLENALPYIIYNINVDAELDRSFHIGNMEGN